MLNQLIDIYSLIVIAAVAASWIDAPRENPAVRLLYQLTEPALEPIRKVLPPMGGMDLSPLALLIGLRVLGSFF